MLEAFKQVFGNLRANKLRSLLTMFGILWGVVSVVILSATGEGFRRGNDKVLMELGRNIAIVWGGRTSTQVGGERAGRRIQLTAADARALQEGSGMIAVVSPEIEAEAIRVKSPYNAAALRVHGVQPQYQFIRTIDIERGRLFRDADERDARRVAIIGADATAQLFGNRDSIGQTVYLNGLPYGVIGKIRKKQQDSNYSGPDNDKVFIPFSSMSRDFPLPDQPPGVVSQIIVAPTPEVVARLPEVLRARTGRLEDVNWPLEVELRRVLSRRHDFDPRDRDAIGVWDTSLESMMFGRMIDSMKTFFMVVGIVTLALGGLGVMNIMLVAVRERTREIGLRKALGATTAQVQQQFFLEGFFLTILSGLAGFAIALGICAAVNTLPMPARFQGMVLTWQAGLQAVATLVTIGVFTSTYPARRAALLPPVEALRTETSVMVRRPFVAVFREIWREAMLGLVRNRVRASLSMMGISWGIIAVVVLLAYGDGLAQALDRGFKGAFGDGVTIVFPGQTSMQAGGERSGRRIRLKLADASAVGEVPLVKAWSPEYWQDMPIAWGTRQASYLVRGVAPAYAAMRSQVPAAGRFINNEDVYEHRRVAFIGSEVARKLFGRVPPTGQSIRIQGMPFEVVGVQKEKVQLANYQRPDKHSIMIPYTTAGQMWNTEYLNVLVYQARDVSVEARATAQIKDVLGRRLRFNPKDERALNTFGSAATADISSGIVLALNLVLTFIGVLTLAIGGVGVMNIMFVSVNERTREIGLRKALGARRSAILLQFLLEGVVTTVIGGAIGILASLAVIWLLSPMPFLSEILDDTTGAADIHMTLSLQLVTITTTILTVVGLASALLPAMRAAALDPIEALRYE